MTTPGGDAGRAAQERLTQEARATASALIDWLSTRVETASAGTQGTTHGTPGPTRTGRSRLGMRPPQSPGPCSWCPVCALVAALRGEQPELTARLAEQASGLMMLLRLMVQAHQDPGHGHPAHAHTHTPPAPGDAAPPAGWPAEWGAFDGWGASPPGPDPGDDVPAGTDGPAEPPAAPEPSRAEPSPPEAPPAAAAPRATSRPRRPADPRGPGGKRVPIRRASPRSAAFRDVTGGAGASATVPPDAGTGAPTSDDTTTPHTAPGTDTARSTDTARPTGAATTTGAGATTTRARSTGTARSSTPRPSTDAAATAPPTAPPTAAPTTAPTTAPTGATTGPARPSVQRIAIRRPERPARRSTSQERPAGPPGGDTAC